MGSPEWDSVDIKIIISKCLRWHKTQCTIAAHYINKRYHNMEELSKAQRDELTKSVADEVHGLIVARLQNVSSGFDMYKITTQVLAYLSASAVCAMQSQARRAECDDAIIARVKTVFYELLDTHHKDITSAYKAEENMGCH